MILFLDFDGVLHPDNDYHGYADFFCWVNILEKILDDFDSDKSKIQIMPQGTLSSTFSGIHLVLSTTWVRLYGLDKATQQLRDHSPSLADRVIGETYVGQWSPARLNMFWGEKSRYEQILKYVNHHQLNNNEWLAIDDLMGGAQEPLWPAEFRDNLVLCEGRLGISDFKAQKEFKDKLSCLNTFS